MSIELFKAALALIAVSSLAVYCLPLDKYSPYCKLDKTARNVMIKQHAMIWHLLPLSVRLGGNVYRSYMDISTKWLTKSDQWKMADFSPLSIASRPLNASELQPGSLLLADRNTLSSYLSLVKNSSAEFENFPNGTAVVQHLTRLEGELGFMLDILQRLERIFGFLQGTKITGNISVVSVTSGSQVTEILPMRTSQDTSYNSNRTSNSATVPTLHSAALRVSVILSDLYSSLLQMDVDFNKIRKIKCY